VRFTNLLKIILKTGARLEQKSNVRCDEHSHDKTPIVRNLKKYFFFVNFNLDFYQFISHSPQADPIKCYKTFLLSV